MYKNIRLSQHDISAINHLFCKNFKKDDQLWLFGSRVDPTKRGGDIDLYIETTIVDAKELVQTKMAYLLDLDLAIGEQKIDLVIRRQDTDMPIYQIAKREGVRMV